MMQQWDDGHGQSRTVTIQDRVFTLRERSKWAAYGIVAGLLLGIILGWVFSGVVSVVVRFLIVVPFVALAVVIFLIYRRFADRGQSNENGRSL
jgi:F0F1-type ATP synthase assembly protein I